METSDYLTQILSALNQNLSVHNVRFTERSVVFIQDDAVEYGAKKRWVHREQMIPSERFAEAFASLLADGPSWIHANAVPFEGNRFLITLAAGRKIGNSQPSINISYEPDKTAEILLTKTLVTAN